MFTRSLLAASVAACSSFAVYAETVLPTTVVTASRTTQTIDNTLASVQVITQAQLAQYPSQDLGEILRFTTGLTVVRAGGFGGQTSIFTRGTNSQHTLILIDGIKINAATSSQANIQNLTLGDIERIEIVKGAMSSLYGSDAIGGVINIITKSATKTETSAQFSTGTNKLVKGSISQTFKKGAFSGLLNTDSLYTNGYGIIDGTTFDSGYKNTGANIKLNYDFGSTNIGLSVRNNQGTAEYIKTTFDYATNKITEYKPLSQYFLNQVAVLSVNSDINSVITSQLRLSQMTDEIDQNQNNDITHTTQKQADWQNTFALNSNNTLVFGLTMTDTQAEYNADYKQSLKNKAIYLQNQWQAQGFNLQTSFRHEDYDSFGTHNTGNIGLGYHFSPTQLVYINAGSAFKAPDLNQLYAPSSNNPNLKPEESRSLELGSKHRLGAFAITTALFQAKLDNLIQYGPAPTYALANLDKSSTKGAELGVKWQDMGLFVSANGSYIHAQNDTTKADLDRRPRRSITLATGYQQEHWGLSGEILGVSHTQDFGGRIAGYAVANASAYWQVIPSTKLRLNIDNIGDKTYGTAYDQTDYRYLATPLSASLSAEVKF